MTWHLFTSACAAVAVLMTAVWILSVIKRDASLVDRVWGMSFVLLAAVYLSFSAHLQWRQGLVMLLVAIWGLRLSLHIHWRNRKHGEDPRYEKMRQHHGTKFWWYSFFSVFLLQALLAVIISAPLAWSLSSDEQAPLNALDLLALGCWGLGFYFEAAADWQLRAFRSKTENRGRVLRSGVWAFCRHPNYFGDAVIWWSFYLFALSVPMGWASFFGPLLMTFFLRYVSGVTLLEKSLSASKPGYLSYKLSTPAFIPKPLLNGARFLFFLAAKALIRTLYRFELTRVEPWPRDAWDRVRLAVLLNHTSLLEPIMLGVLPGRYLWNFANHGTFAVADVTYHRPLVGRLIRCLAPKPVPLTRKRDDSWQQFLQSVETSDCVIFMPEGRMKRRNGLDKFGKPMTVKGGIVDLMESLQSGRMLICYSGGLHHIQAPGQGFPKLFKTVSVRFESLRIEEYLAQFAGLPDRTAAITADLEQRRDRHTKTL